MYLGRCTLDLRVRVRVRVRVRARVRVRRDLLELGLEWRALVPRVLEEIRRDLVVLHQAEELLHDQYYRVTKGLLQGYYGVRTWTQVDHEQMSEGVSLTQARHSSRAG